MRESDLQAAIAAKDAHIAFLKKEMDTLYAQLEAKDKQISSCLDIIRNYQRIIESMRA